jgi:uncharacterized membrane protein
MTDAGTFIAVLFSGMVAGGLTLVAFAVVPVFEQLSVADWTRLHRALDRNVDRFMPALTVLAIVAGTVAVTQAATTESRLLLLAGVLCDVAVAVISQTLNRPLNRAVRAWDPEMPPAHAGAVRGRWVRFHRLRTWTGIAAAVLFTAGLAQTVG